MVGVKSIKIDDENESFIVEHSQGRTVVTSEEAETLTLKAVGLMEDGVYYFDDARCSLDKARKELVCGD
jgi:hypothetical protein